ncbi:MAG: WXG100 family type VII secretion target [Clostridia bacterium]
MARIANVDYGAMPGQAREMRTSARQLNSEMTKVYKNIEEMHNSWYGTRYNELVKSFNRMIPDLNEMLSLVVQVVPFTLETVANNYSRADNGSNITAASTEGPEKVLDLPVVNDIGMRFLTDNVSDIQQRIVTSFSNAYDLMNTIEATYGKIQWESEAAEAFRARFKELKNNISNEIEDIKVQFADLMTKTKDDIQKAENANTVV